MRVNRAAVCLNNVMGVHAMMPGEGDDSEEGVRTCALQPLAQYRRFFGRFVVECSCSSCMWLEDL